jgi:preprotein translocase subunit SecA
MMRRIREGATEYLFKVRIEKETELPIAEAQGQPQQVMEHRGSSADESRSPVRRGEKKVGRNDPCSCGSGKKYKKCHGK